MSIDDELPLPKTVKFDSNGCHCIAYVAFLDVGNQYGLNLHTCLINLGDKRPAVHVEYLPHACRVNINETFWFDCQPDKAAEIEALFLK